METTPTPTIPRLALVVTNVLTWLATVILTIIYSSGRLHYHPAYVSDLHPTHFDPAGWAFSIWALIFILTGIFAMYQAVPSRRDSFFVYNLIGPWFAVHNLSLFIWMFCFAFNHIWASLVFMLIAFASAFVIYARLGIDYSIVGRTRTDKYGTSLTTPDFWILQVPFSLTLGWLSFILVANFATAIATKSHHLGWSGDGWSILFQIVLTVLSFMVLRIRHDPFFSGPISWGFFALADSYRDQTVLFTASLVCAIITGIATIVSMVHLFFHHYFHRERYVSVEPQ